MNCHCPVCSQSDFTYHCRYQKYHYQNQIDIIRVYCLSCGSTHALIPEYSLPGTSIGSAEAGNYMKLRLSGGSQKEAAEIFITRGMSEKYGISFDKRFTHANRKAQVLFPEENDPLHSPRQLFQSEPTDSANLFITVNDLFLERGFNPLYFSRNNILRIREIKSAKRFPLNREGVCPVCEILDSG